MELVSSPVRETTKCVVVSATGGPAAFPVELSLGDQSAKSVRGWQGNSATTAPNVWVFTGRLSATECAARLGASDGIVDGMCLSDSAGTEWQLDEDTRVITVFFETANSSGSTQSANLVIREFSRDRIGYG